MVWLGIGIGVVVGAGGAYLGLCWYIGKAYTS